MPATPEYAYQYDDIGNRITSTDLGTNRTYTANSLNQYSAITTSDLGLQTSSFEPHFDDDGNQTRIQTATGVWSVQYNGENRPVLWTGGTPSAATNIVMSFDRMGRRVEYLETAGGSQSSATETNAYHRFVYDNYFCIQRLEAANGNAVDLVFVWDVTEWKLTWYFDITQKLYNYHPGGMYELRTKCLNKYGGSGNQCIYDGCGKLITNRPGAGTADYSRQLQNLCDSGRDRARPSRNAYFELCLCSYGRADLRVGRVLQLPHSSPEGERSHVRDDVKPFDDARELDKNVREKEDMLTSIMRFGQHGKKLFNRNVILMACSSYCSVLGCARRVRRNSNIIAYNIDFSSFVE